MIFIQYFIEKQMWQNLSQSISKRLILKFKLPYNFDIDFFLSGSFLKPCYQILDENNVPMLELEGPICIFDGAFCPCDNEFKVIFYEKYILCSIGSKISLNVLNFC